MSFPHVIYNVRDFFAQTTMPAIAHLGPLKEVFHYARDFLWLSPLCARALG